MRLLPKEYDKRVSAAVSHYWKTLVSQARKQTAGDADRGGRSAVTGGKQMDGFCRLIHWVCTVNGLEEADVNLAGKSSLTIPGYYRATKEWDILVVRDRHLVAAIEFKSQKGPSFGNNFNNRTEEALGTAEDFWTAYREGAFGKESPRPWTGWLMLLEDCKRSITPLKEPRMSFPLLPEFNDTSYAKRYEILARKLMLEKKYDHAAFLMSCAKTGANGQFTEPAKDLTMQKFLLSLAAHVRAFVEGK